VDEKVMKILGLIPARGGSKAIPGKNIKLLEGKSLIQRAYETARKSKYLDRIILSTDSNEIAEHAKSFGLEVPFIRPQEFAKDESPMIDAIVHTIETLKKSGYLPDAVMLLQPTSPLRKAEHIDEAIELLKDNDSVCSVIEIPQDMSPHYVMKITADGHLDYFLPEGKNFKRRQDVPKAYKRDGTIFLTRTEVLLNEKNVYGKRCIPYFMDASLAINIDTPEEWKMAENFLKEGKEI
jgi:CMP-N,N'-diacetyllegionaminic acid synthase